MVSLCFIWMFTTKTWWQTGFPFISWKIPLCGLAAFGWYHIPSGKLTLQWKMDPWRMHFLLNMGIFHCYVSLPEGTHNLDTCTAFFQCFSGSSTSSNHLFWRPESLDLIPWANRLSGAATPKSERNTSWHQRRRFGWGKVGGGYPPTGPKIPRKKDPPKMNKRPLKKKNMFKGNGIFQPPIFMGYLSFQGGYLRNEKGFSKDCSQINGDVHIRVIPNTWNLTSTHIELGIVSSPKKNRW